MDLDLKEPICCIEVIRCVLRVGGLSVIIEEVDFMGDVWEVW